MIFVLIYTAFSAVLSYYNFRLIRQGKRIYHGLNGLLHIVAAFVAGYLYGWEKSVALLLLVRVIFDTTLNILRGLGVGYMSHYPKSIVDRIEIWFLHGVTTVILYKKKFISENNVEAVAIGFRLLVLLAGVYFLFLN